MSGVVPVIASIVLKVTIVTAVALAGGRLARRSRAAVRHIMLAAAFATLLITPIASFVVPKVDVAVPIAAPSSAIPALVETDAALAVADAAVPITPVASRAPWPSWAQLTFGVWALGATLFLLPIGAGLWQVRALRRSALPSPRAQTIADAFTGRARVDVLHHERAAGPMTCGVVRPA